MAKDSHYSVCQGLDPPQVFAVDIKASEFILSGSTIWMHFSLASSWAGPVAGALLLLSLLGLLTTVLCCRPMMPSLRKEVERWLLGACVLRQENGRIPSRHQVKPSLTAGGRPLNQKDFLMGSSREHTRAVSGGRPSVAEALRAQASVICLQHHSLPPSPHN